MISILEIVPKKEKAATTSMLLKLTGEIIEYPIVADRIGANGIA